MADNLDIHVRIAADAARYAQGLLGAEQRTHKFGSAVRNEFANIKASIGDIRGQMAALGVSFVAMQSVAQSAKLDKSLTQIGQTAGESRKNIIALRAELFRMSDDTGQQVEDLKRGFDNAVQAGLNFKEALPVIDATNKAMAVTGANAERLTGGLTVAATAFQFDLSKPKQASLLLDKMTVAGRLGNAELENLSDIFARVGVNASSAGMGFDQTLGFIEGLSQIERQPERLATLADSTLRLFTNLNYMKAAAKATKVRFFDHDGSRRDSIAVLQDIKKQYDQLKTDKQRATYIQKAFGKADLDTIKGLKALLAGDMLNKVGVFTGQIKNASGAIEKDLPEAINNAVDATGRLQASLRKAADDFTKPIRDTFTSIAGFTLDKKENGGLGLDGKDLLGGAAAIGGAALVGGAAWRIFRSGKGGAGPLGLPGVVGDAAGLGKNIAIGKTLQSAAGVQPVYVVNMPDSGLTGKDFAGALPGGTGLAKTGGLLSKSKTMLALAAGMPLSAWGSMGVAGLSTAAAGVGAAGAVGYGTGTLINKGLNAAGAGDWMAENIGGSINRVLALFGNEEARRIEAINDKLKNTDLNGKISIELTGPGAGQAQVRTSSGRNLRINAPLGIYMQGVD